MSIYLNKIFLVGITFLDEKKQLIDQFQTHGELIKIENGIMQIQRDDKTIYQVPFMKDAIRKANPGIYRERSTGIEIQDPNYITQWTVDGIKDSNNIRKYKDIGFIPQEWIQNK